MAQSKTKFLYSKKTHQPQWPFHVVVKQHYNKKILYISYGGGRKEGGGAWSENLNNVHPRTSNMIKDYLGQRTVDDLLALLEIPPTKKGKETNTNAKQRKN